MPGANKKAAVGSVPTAEFVAAMGQHVSSVCVITTLANGERFGLTATAVSSVCATPPRLLVCVNATGLTHEKIASSGMLCVNVLSETQEKVAKAFAGMLGRDVERFAVGQWSHLLTGSPMLVGAAASFDCRIVESLAQHSHTIFVCDVVATSFQMGVEPLLYGSRRFRTLRKTLTQAASEDANLEMLHF